MASNLKLVGGSPFMGSPLVYSVTAASITGDISFHKIKIEVTAGLALSSDDMVENQENKIVLTFSTPVNSGQTVQVDISSALQAAADNYVYSVNPPSVYPHVVFSLKAWDEYMQNGQEAQKTAEVTNGGGSVILGKVSDMSRMFANGNLLAQNFSKKPLNDNPEVVCDGDTVVVPLNWEKAYNIGNLISGPTSQLYTVSMTDAEKKTGCLKQYGGHPYYLLSSSASKNVKNRYQFRFINSLGVMESFTVFCNGTQQMKMSSEKHDIAIQESFSKFSRGIYEKKNDMEVLKLSSGPMTAAWVSWFLHEFLMTQVAWIFINEHWVPCNITADDTITALDMTKNDYTSIDFSVEMNFYGSLF